MKSSNSSDTRLAIHGGAGCLPAHLLRPPLRERFEEGLFKALNTGRTILLDGGSAIDAVTESVVILEDNELFNAGRGAVLCADGSIELSASIMNGQNQSAGGMAGIKRCKNPIRAARSIIGHSHVLLSGPKADRHAQLKGQKMVPSPYFYTRYRRHQWARLAGEKPVIPDHGPSDSMQGTVGAVARDCRGHMAAATSTGGMVNQLAGRIGDTPVIGAGTWADDRTCALSATGTGDTFARSAFARQVSDLIEYAKLPAADAAHTALRRISDLGGEGGCILIDSRGTLCLPFNSPQMLRGWMDESANLRIAILPNENRCKTSRENLC